VGDFALIRGEKVVLRAIEASDVEKLWNWQQDEEVMRLRDYPSPPRSYAEVEREYTGTESETDRIRLGIMTTEGILIGEISLANMERRVGDAELTIFIGDKAFWGRGYGSDAVRAMCKYAFEQMNLHRVTLFVHAENFRAIKAYEKCGFIEEGRAREAEYMDGRYSDIVSMGLLRDELKQG